MNAWTYKCINFITYSQINISTYFISNKCKFLFACTYMKFAYVHIHLIWNIQMNASKHFVLKKNICFCTEHSFVKRNIMCSNGTFCFSHGTFVSHTEYWFPTRCGLSSGSLSNPVYATSDCQSSKLEFSNFANLISKNFIYNYLYYYDWHNYKFAICQFSNFIVLLYAIANLHITISTY